MIRNAVIAGISLTFCIAHSGPSFRAGIAAVDISPEKYPVIVNAMFTERTAKRTVDPLFSRCIVLDDGTNRLAITVVDTCMLPRDLIDEAKQLASPFRADRILVSATHTHSAPSAMGCLGSRVDPDYAKALPAKIAESITRATTNLQPARIGWTVVQDHEHTFNRRWIRRPDRIEVDPFGERTVRANMHPGHESPDVIGPSGPVDPDLSIVSIQTADGRPLALLANYSMHYYGSSLLSSDYFGKFSEKMATHGYFAIMSQGTSGDLMWMDYGKPRREIGYAAYAEEIAERVIKALKGIKYREHVSLGMAEARMRLRYRVPDEMRLAWARKVAADVGDRLPQKLPEIYAVEAMHLHERQSTELVLQAIRIGELGVTAIPNEVFAITGLKLKAQSPLEPTFNLELANGAEGYIPPPEQHELGGYTTWPARTAGLEVEAEPKMVEELLQLLEKVSGKKRRKVEDAGNRRLLTRAALLDGKPVGYWAMDQFSDERREFEGGVAFYVEGVVNRAVHFAGGRLHAKVRLDEAYTAEMWIWNGMPNGVRPITGYFFSRGAETLAISRSGELMFRQGERSFAGKQTIRPRTWYHVALVRGGTKVAVYLDGALEISGNAEVSEAAEVFIGGSSSNEANFEGKMDEVALYDRALSGDEISQHAQKP